MHEFIIRGTRGTVAACGKDFLKHGGHTTCLSLRTDEGLIIVDAGTGISHVAKEIAALDVPPPITMLFTHFHMDHVVGLPSFNPLYSKNACITIMADPRREQEWRETLTTFIDKPYWPIGLRESDAVYMTDIPYESENMELYGATVSWFDVPHPQSCLAYRFEISGASVVVATDTEYALDDIDPAFIEFCRGADHLIHDAHFTSKEYEKHIGWGHSTNDVAARVANEAGVGQLILTHHAPGRIDDDIDSIVEETRKSFANTCAASSNMVVLEKGWGLKPRTKFGMQAPET
jgi:ribonuclease BN (tRNA processing enzyme)